MRRIFIIIGLVFVTCSLMGAPLRLVDEDVIAMPLKVLGIITLLSLIPVLLVSITSFTRIIIVLGFLRQGLGTQTGVPSPVLIALALFLTVFIMRPTFEKINKEAIQPYLRHEINDKEAIERAIPPLREFMFRQVREKDLGLLMSTAGLPKPHNKEDVPMSTLIPAFIMSELRRAFQMGFILYLPFLVIDMVISSVLLSLGMFMLPPVLISLPFKLLLFVLVDGWNMVVKSLVASFNL